VFIVGGVLIKNAGPRLDWLFVELARMTSRGVALVATTLSNPHPSERESAPLVPRIAEVLPLTWGRLQTCAWEAESFGSVGESSLRG